MKLPDTRLQDMARDVLAGQGWLSRQPVVLRNLVLDSAQAMRVPAKTYLYHQGDDPNGIYGVASGCLMLETVQEDGRYLALGVMAEGGWFGELSTIEGGARPSSAFALTDTVVMHISPALFAHIIERDPTHMMSFASLLSEKVRTMHRLREENAAGDRIRRVSAALLSLANARDWLQITAETHIPVTQDHIASLANLSRQTANLALKTLEKSGLIARRYGAIVLLPGQAGA